ncbi:MAG: hypothetical protein QXO75_04015 [Nitrososphaerota archaeon]
MEKERKSKLFTLQQYLQKIYSILILTGGLKITVKVISVLPKRVG